MVKQSILQSDTFIRFSEQVTQLTSQSTLGDSTTLSSSVNNKDFDWQNQTMNPVFPSTPNQVGVNSMGVEAGVCTCLNLETLKCFEVVEDQYEELGVIFSNCIAIQPSNPAFPTHSGAVVLMGAPKGGFLEVNFVRPVNTVNALVTSSQRLVLSAYNREQKIIAQTVLPVGNLANSDSSLPPNTQLTIKAKEIYSVTFCAFDGQFTLDDFSFCL